MNILAQIIGGLAVISFITSIQRKKKSEILENQIVANILYALQYFLLKIYIAGFMNIVSVIRCAIFYKYTKEKKKVPFSYAIFFIVLIIIFGFFGYENILSLVPIIITILYVLSTYQDNLKILRVFFLVCSIIWFFYNLYVSAYAAVIGNVFELISGIISLVRFKKKK